MFSGNPADPCFIDQSPVEKCFVYGLSADDENRIDSFVFERFGHFLDRSIGFKAFDHAGSKDDIPAIRQGATDGFIGLASHDDNAAGRQTLEILKIFAIVPWKLSFVPDGPIIGYGGEEYCLHENMRGILFLF